MSKQNLYADMFAGAVDATVAAAEKVDEGKRMKQPGEQKAHPLWLIGHLAQVNSVVVHAWCCDGEGLTPKEYRKLFSPGIMGGDPIGSDPAGYPSWDNVVANYKKVGDACVEKIRNLSDDELDGDLRGGIPDSAKESLGSVEKTLVRMIGHDAYHRGQMNMLAALN